MYWTIIQLRDDFVVVVVVVVAAALLRRFYRHPETSLCELWDMKYLQLRYCMTISLLRGIYTYMVK
jgi:hypothetical protein